MERRKLIAGNWKMYKTIADALALATELKRLLAMVRKVDIAVVPPALFVEPLVRRLQDSNLAVGVQNIHASGFGAFTGELSADMLPGLGVTYCLVGHSERRQHFGEIDETVNRKVKALVAAGITPIVCIGETLEQREYKETFSVLRRQLSVGLAALRAEEVGRLVLAYEPVWAIGTGRNATPEMVQEVHTWLRDWLASTFDAMTANNVRIQYGGSVKPDNAPQLLAVPNVDGALVGGASLDPNSFAAIVKAVS